MNPLTTTPAPLDPPHRVLLGPGPSPVAPSVLRAAHPSLLATLADGILLVVRVGSTPKAMVEEAFQMLENLGGNVLGTCATSVQED